MAPSQHICMLAAENDVIPGAKVGGIGDVVRDIPRALADENTKVTVIIPAYGAFHELPDAVSVGICTTLFRGQTQRIEVFELAPGRDNNVRYLVLHHPLFAVGGKGVVYCDDDADQPFATDANKFALFNVAALNAIISELIEPVTVLHLHDWHAALALALVHFDDSFQSLRGIRTVFSIHNLALQGIRPFAGDTSSMQAWYPHLHYNPVSLADPRWPHCVNPVAGAIRLADKVHTVSPTYAQEILQPNNTENGFHGGEGLENELQQAAQEKRLIGIINGIDYPKKSLQKLGWPSFTRQLGDEILRLIGKQGTLRSIDYLAHQRVLQQMQQKRPAHVLTSVGRLTDQKMALLLQTLPDGRVPLDVLMSSLSDRALFILLGSGDTALEAQCQEIASNHPHLLFINQYSPKLSSLLFSNGDLFLMPSSFEPCGISQMLAMRDGQPCLAHSVGGLRDTILDNNDGFLFSGASMHEQAVALLARTEQVLQMREKKPQQFTRIADKASNKRFDWQDSAARYHSELYS